jgi:phenylacetate-CoA ligase
MTTQKMPQLTQRLGPVRLTRIPGNAAIGKQVELYVRSAPQLLEGYAGCLELLARELRTRRTYPRPRWVISRGEVLAPAAQELLRHVFDCPVANFYNSEEIGNMAWECADRPGILHVNSDACILELVDERGEAVPPGTEGRVVVTNLYNRTMPFLRYDIGDHATWDDSRPHRCSCGAATPTLASIDGRTDDFILTPDGRRISPLIVLTTVLNACARVTPEGAHVGQVQQFQVVQESQGEAEVRIVPRGSLPPRLDYRMREEFGKLHQGFRIQISIVDSIPSGPSGKLKRIVSRTGR